METISHLIRDAAYELSGDTDAYAPLIENIGACRFVLLGEATHGTKEFYRHRAEITKELILHHGFNVVAIEADWPDTCRVNRYINQRGTDATSEQALLDFTRFPSWMWRNIEIEGLIQWLYQHNYEQREEEKTTFFGLDLYSLYSSAKAVINYLDTVDPEASRQARRRYACLEGFQAKPQAYGLQVALGMQKECETAIIEQLLELRAKRLEYLEHDGLTAMDAYFCAEQNAKLIGRAQHYYSAMFTGEVNTWNLRDAHMFETVELLHEYLVKSREREAKVIIWAHNSHIGNAKATDMGRRGEFNIGQLLKEKYPDETFSLGFTTSIGTVTAAHEWDGQPFTQAIRPPLDESYERVFSRCGLGEFLLFFQEPIIQKALTEPKLERAIGVLYLPSTERISHYFTASIAQQFDAVIHIEETSALTPLEPVIQPGTLLASPF